MNGSLGSITNILVVVGCQVCLLFGLMLPQDKEDYKDTELWRVGFAVPWFISFTQVALLFLVYKYEPIDYLIQKGDTEKAISFVKMVYSPKQSDDDYH